MRASGALPVADRYLGATIKCNKCYIRSMEEELRIVRVYGDALRLAKLSAIEEDTTQTDLISRAIREYVRSRYPHLQKQYEMALETES